jgi:hypothetical protein
MAHICSRASHLTIAIFHYRMRYAVSLSPKYVILYGDITAIAVALLPVVYKSHINNSLRTTAFRLM